MKPNAMETNMRSLVPGVLSQPALLFYAASSPAPIGRASPRARFSGVRVDKGRADFSFWAELPRHRQTHAIPRGSRDA
jgi:hypothetical protein